MACPGSATCIDAECKNDFGVFYGLDSSFGPNGPTFEPNLGQPNLVQAGGPYDFVSHQGAASIFLSSSAVMFRLGNATLRASIAGGQTAASPEPLEPQPGRINYLIGNKPEQWVTNIPTYARVQYRDVYPGIDVVYYGASGQLEHDFIVSPGTDPSAIQLEFEGADRMQTDSEGGIELTVGSQTVHWKKPVLYQTTATGRRQMVEGRYRVGRDQRAGFETGVYDVTRPLVIDPVVAFTTYYGRGGSESATRVATDAAGNAYIVGVTNDSVFGYTGGAFLGPNSLSVIAGDAMITKISADGKTVIYSTHIGGGSFEFGGGIAVDSAGNIYITGGTASPDYPLTSGSFQGQPDPASTTDPGNCFVTKLNAAGSALIYSRLIGGTGLDVCFGLAVDSAGNAYVAGGTTSKDFPTQNAFQAGARVGTTAATISDAFAAKLSPDGKQLLYSTYIGGGGNDVALALALDGNGNAYLTGGTTSSDFPVSPGALQTTYGGGQGTPAIPDFNTGDAFVVKLSPTGARLYATYLGGAKDDVAIGIAVDAQGSAYVAGSTLSTDFPLQQAFQKTYSGAGGELNYPCGDAFIAKLNPQGSGLVYSSYLGGSADDRAAGVAVDSAGNAYLTGNTLSGNFPVSQDAAQKKHAGQTTDSFLTGDAFFAQVGPTGALVYSSFLGGSGNDWGIGVAVDGQGGIVIAGGTNSPDFPATQGVAQLRYGGGDTRFTPAGDAFVTRFGATPTLSISSIGSAASYAAQAVSPGEIVVLTGTGIGPATLAGLALDANGGVAKTLAQTQILFDDVAAPLVYVSAAQSAAVVPYAVSGRTSTNVVVVYNGARSAAVPVPVASAVPALFSADSSGRGQGAILNQDNSYNSAQNPAAKGSTVQLFGTGEGQTMPPGLDGRIAASVFPKPVLPVAVMIGNMRIDNLPYAGAAPSSLSGLLQVNVTVPLDAPSGNVPVSLIIGGVSSQTGLTLAVR